MLNSYYAFYSALTVGTVLSIAICSKVALSFTLPSVKTVKTRNLKLYENHGRISTSSSDLYYNDTTITPATPWELLSPNTLVGANNYHYAHLEALLKATLPRHESNAQINKILNSSETLLRSLYYEATQQQSFPTAPPGQRKHQIIANTYVDMGAITSIGFDYDYSLLTYTDEFLSLLYDTALSILVRDKRYPKEMCDELKGKFDPLFSIKGLVVDIELGWITHLSYTHKVMMILCLIWNNLSLLVFIVILLLLKKFCQ
jgi:hypothetical protein